MHSGALQGLKMAPSQKKKCGQMKPELPQFFRGREIRIRSWWPFSFSRSFNGEQQRIICFSDVIFLNQSVQEIQGGCNYAVSRLLLKPFGILMAQVSNRLGPARAAPTTITIRVTNAGHFLHANAGHFLHAQDAVDLQ